MQLDGQVFLKQLQGRLSPRNEVLLVPVLFSDTAPLLKGPQDCFKEQVQTNMRI